MIALIASLLAIATPPAFAAEETLKIGKYPGDAGYFVQRGTSGTIESALFMDAKTFKKLESLKIRNASETRTCVVEGGVQSIGYTIFTIKSCR